MFCPFQYQTSAQQRHIQQLRLRRPTGKLSCRSFCCPQSDIGLGWHAVLLGRLRHEHGERERDAYDYQDALERQVQAAR
jgi:hypothetical protein